ncbi:hypothetical protein MANES_04G092500v8 [Manihot esculenta]|nr:hypothetical protein MANES_04G092500v8 [Manihot esculenta]
MCCRGKNIGADNNKKNIQNEHGDCTCKDIHQIDSTQKWEEKLSEANRDGKSIIVNFCSSWCAPSKSIARTFCDLAEKYSSIVFLSVDIDELGELSSSWEVKSTPTFFFLKNGRQVDKLVGADKRELQKKTAALSSLPNDS